MISHEDDHEENREDRSPGRKGFPGGSAKLPRLVGPAAEDHVLASRDGGPAVMIVEGGFAAGHADEHPDGPVVASFADYSPPESLFYVHEVEETVETPAPTPHAALGVAPGASWREIKAAHRSLMAQLHPDRFVTASERQQREAADRLAEVNLAFHNLSKERTAS